MIEVETLKALVVHCSLDIERLLVLQISRQRKEYQYYNIRQWKGSYSKEPLRVLEFTRWPLSISRGPRCVLLQTRRKETTTKKYRSSADLPCMADSERHKQEKQGHWSESRICRDWTINFCYDIAGTKDGSSAYSDVKLNVSPQPLSCQSSPAEKAVCDIPWCHGACSMSVVRALAVSGRSDVLTVAYGSSKVALVA